jgi:hypothetical protein
MDRRDGEGSDGEGEGDGDGEEVCSDRFSLGYTIGAGLFMFGPGPAEGPGPALAPEVFASVSVT